MLAVVCSVLIAIITTVFFAIGFEGFLTTGSWSLFADDFHLLGDGMPFIALALFLLIGPPPPQRARADNVVHHINVWAMLLAGGWSVVMGLYHWYSPAPIERVVLWFALTELAGNSLQLFLMIPTKGHLSEHTFAGLVLHLSIDVLGSALVVVSGYVIYYHLDWYWHGFSYNWESADGTTSILVGVLTFAAGIHCWQHSDHDEHFKGHHNHHRGHHHHHEHVHRQGYYPEGESESPYWTAP